MDPPATITDDVADAHASRFSEDHSSILDEDKDFQKAVRASLEEDQANAAQPSTPTGRRRERQERLNVEEEMHEPLRSRMRHSTGPSTPGSGYRSMRRFGPHNEREDASEKYQKTSSSRRNRQKSSHDIEEEGDLVSYPSRKSPFLNPIAASLLDEDVEDLAEEEDNAHFEFLDDDEAQLQAAIASSLGQPFQVPQRILDKTYRTYEMDKESQSIPEDVQRITKLREDMLIKASQSTTSEHELPPTVSSETSISRSHDAEPADDGAEEKNTLSTEEMRRRRLARFEGL
jgi:hypothetical protein